MPTRFIPSSLPLRTLRFSVLVLLAGLMMACGGADQERPDGIGFGGGDGGPDYEEGPCEDGDAQVCSATIYQANGVKSCFRGVRQCVEGKWSPCSEPPDDATN